MDLAMDAKQKPVWQYHLYSIFLCFVLAGLMTLFIVGTKADMNNESSGRVELLGEVLTAESIAQATYIAMLEKEDSIVSATNAGRKSLVPALVDANFLKQNLKNTAAKVSIKTQDESTIVISVDLPSNNLFQYGLCGWLTELESDPAFEKIFSHGKIAQCNNASFTFSKRYGYVTT